MKYVNLGRTGMKISQVCLGTLSFGNEREYMIGLDEARPIIEKAIDLGINFFDTANVYSRGRSEEITGEVLKDYRSDVVIATKVSQSMGDGPNDQGLSRLHIMNQIEGSLRRLQTDHIDLYWIHRWDYNTPIKQTLSTLDDLVHQGKVRCVGASSMWAWQLAKALWTSDKLGLVRFEGMQNHYNLAYREEEREMNPLCRDQGISIIPWSPLARGFLAGKYKRGETPKSVRFDSDPYLQDRYFKDEDFDVVEQVERIADEKDVTPAQVALSWLVHKGAVPVIGIKRVEHVETAVESLDVRLTNEDMNQLEAPYLPHPIIGHQ